MATTLINQGARRIGYADGKDLAPGEAAVFTDERAAYLQKLYPHELKSLADITKSFEATEIVATVKEDGTVEETASKEEKKEKGKRA